MKDRDKALAEFDAILKSRSEGIVASIFARAEAAETWGDTALAIADYRKFIDLNNRKGWVAHQALRRLGGGVKVLARAAKEILLRLKLSMCSLAALKAGTTFGWIAGCSDRDYLLKIQANQRQRDAHSVSKTSRRSVQRELRRGKKETIEPCVIEIAIFRCFAGQVVRISGAILTQPWT